MDIFFPQSRLGRQFGRLLEGCCEARERGVLIACVGDFTSAVVFCPAPPATASRFCLVEVQEGGPEVLVDETVFRFHGATTAPEKLVPSKVNDAF